MRLWLFLLALPALAQKLTVMPPSVELTGPEARQQLIAEGTVGEHSEDWTRTAQWSSSDPNIAVVDAHGVISPVGDGEAKITVTANGATSAVAVRVKTARAPFTWSFRNHVIPVMTKMGCNQGACHGALAGKNGFKLTLRGYDPDADYDTLTRASVGRRVSLADPDASLILAKPSFAIPHGGGKRFAKDSLEYRVIREWIAADTPPPASSDVQIQGLEVFPPAAVLTPGAEQQLAVRARYSDGHTEDVTRWVKFSSSNEGVATVDDWGRVKMNGAGEAAITLYYASRVLYSRLSVPFPNTVSAAAYEQFPRKNFVDDLVIAKLRNLHLAPSKLADDATFLRRAYLDAAGVLPSAEEVERFLADSAADKRAKLVEQLMERDEFADYWAYKWSDLLLVSSKKLNTTTMWAFYNWIRDSVKQNKPWNAFAREIFLSSGSTRENGALNYFVLHKDPIELSENATQAFLGQRITCARCHNHPLEKWTQTQYYQMANLFARVGVKIGSSPGEQIVFAKASGDVLHPKLARPLPPTPLDGQSIALDSTDDRRIAFAAWLTSPKNEMFARTIVNRVWANFMGRGLVDPVDDLRATNPASNEELLSALSKDFVDHGYDVRRLIRTVMNSSAYQLSSEANATNQSDNIYYSKHIIRRLSAEIILDAMSQVTGAPTSFAGYPAGTRAMQLPDTQVKSEFLTSFGRPARNICDAAERFSDPTIAQALAVINGDTLNKKLSAADGTIALLIKVGMSDRRILEFMTLSAFSRYPTESEKALVAAVGGPGHRQAVEDMVWAMLTSKEFLFQH
uniref:Cytochrome c domain-containing protein n=1 Tax=Solibacter usitatus (strain Ellin6076) TaxID=234267 RepID=Q01UL4_SOLUE